MTSRFPPFAFVEMVSPYNKKNITRWLEDMNFMFSWQEQYLTRSCHSNIKFISSRHRVISSMNWTESHLLSTSYRNAARIFQVLRTNFSIILHFNPPPPPPRPATRSCFPPSGLKRSCGPNIRDILGRSLIFISLRRAAASRQEYFDMDTALFNCPLTCTTLSIVADTRNNVEVWVSGNSSL